MFTDYDLTVGRAGGGILVCQSALSRSGLTYSWMNMLQIGIDNLLVDGAGGWMVEYLFSPWAEKLFEVHPAETHPSILIPTRERAIVESMILREHVDEGILIEAIKTYLEEVQVLNRLYEVCDMFGKQYCKDLDYWLEEACNDYDD